MSNKMTVQTKTNTQAKTTPRPTRSQTRPFFGPKPLREPEAPDLKTQLASARSLGHHFEAIPVQVGPEGGPAPPEVESAINRARGRGQPLHGAVQKQMGETMGHDFSSVRVHADSEADTLNRQLSAKAFTIGRDVFFSHRAYEPGSSSGREMIAHELSHVAQQSTARVPTSGPGLTVRPANDALEQEADKAAQQSATVLGNQAVGQLLGRTAQSYSTQGDVVQRRNGATVNNWHTHNVRAGDNSITHEVRWGSSTDNMNDLDDVWTREEVAWEKLCPWSNEADYKQKGEHHGLGPVKGAQGGANTDTHEVARPYWDPDVPPLNPGGTMNFVQKQVYQYSTDSKTPWVDIDNSNYTLTRTLRRGIFNKNKLTFTLRKQGVTDNGVNQTSTKEVSLTGV